MNNTDEIYMEKLEKIQKRISPEHHANTLKRMGLKQGRLIDAHNLLPLPFGQKFRLNH